jgi:hypothetical protein
MWSWVTRRLRAVIGDDGTGAVAAPHARAGRYSGSRMTRPAGSAIPVSPMSM